MNVKNINTNKKYLKDVLPLKQLPINEKLKNLNCLKKKLQHMVRKQ